MSSNFYIEYHSTYLLVHHAPDFDITNEGMTKFWITLAAAYQTTGCKRIIWEGRIGERPMNNTQIFNSASQGAQIALGLKLACVFENYIADERTAFFKSVALRKGAIIEFFTNREEAFTWLGLDPETKNIYQQLA